MPDVHICLTDEELAEAADLDSLDPRRRELNECARCRARLAAFIEFMRPAGEPSHAEADLAERRLAAALDAEVFGTAPAEHPENPAANWWQRLSRPAAWSVFAVAAATFVVIFAVHELRGPGTTPIVLRQDAPGSVLIVHDPQRLDSGQWRLSWNAFPEADRYKVIIYDEALDVVREIEAGANLSADLAPPSENILLWRVRAFRGADSIAESEVRIFHVTP